MTFDVLRAVLGITAVLITFAFSIWLWRIGTRGSAARQLSVLLAVEGFTLGSSGGIVTFAVLPAPSASQLLVLLWVHHSCDIALIALYPPFLARALPTRWTLPFAKTPVRIGLVIFAVTLLVFVMSGGLAGYLRRVPILYLVMCLTFVYAFAVSLHAWRVATAETQRRRARSFVLGFGLRDVFWGSIYGASSYLYLTTQGPPLSTPKWFVVYPLGTLLEVPLIAYGILSTQLFDIDLRLKWTIRQTTLAAIVLAIVYLTSEAAKHLLSEEVGPWPGIIAAALVVFSLAPLQRVAERVANRAMPETVSTPQYLAYRKMQVYEAALTEALVGGISEKERAILTRLRESLEVSADDARALEDGLRARLTAGTAV